MLKSKAASAWKCHRPAPIKHYCRQQLLPPPLIKSYYLPLPHPLTQAPVNILNDKCAPN